MKKALNTLLCAALVCSATLGLAACGKKEVKIVDVQGQMPALNEVAMGTSDVAFVDYTLAASQCGKGNFSDLRIVSGIELSKEEFAVGIRKEDTALKAGIDAALTKLYNDGTMEAKRKEFGEAEIATCNLSTRSAGEIDGTLGAGKTLKVGVTDYPPMDYEVDGVWTGFDAEMARLVGSELGYDAVTFVEIDWEQKITELKSGKIDLIWNGMTVTDELGNEMLFSVSYATNYQVAVVKKDNAEKLGTIAKMKDSGVKVAVEGGSAGEDAAKDAFGL